jgi:hypothetical protein
MAAGLQNKPADHRHERHYRHAGEKNAYLSHFLHDNEGDAGMTLPEHPINLPSLGNPIGLRKSDTDDAHDDELQGFSKGGGRGTLFCRREIV